MCVPAPARTVDDNLIYVSCSLSVVFIAQFNECDDEKKTSVAVCRFSLEASQVAKTKTKII